MSAPAGSGRARVAAALRRGIAAGLIAGVLAGLLGLAVGEPSLDAAIALEQGSAAALAEGGHTTAAAAAGVTRTQQKVGLVAGAALVGLAAGALFGLAGAWAAGRVAGDAWTRSLKLGGVAVAALVVLPALKYPPNPPGAGDPATVGLRTALYLGLGGLGLLLSAALWTGARLLGDTALSTPVRHTVIAAASIAAAAALLAGLPDVGGAGPVPGELLWRFRLGSLATQASLYGGTAVLFGLLSARAVVR